MGGPGLVEAVFAGMFPDAFDRVVPVRKHKVCADCLPRLHCALPLLACCVQDVMSTFCCLLSSTGSHVLGAANKPRRLPRPSGMRSRHLCAATAPVDHAGKGSRIMAGPLHAAVLHACQAVDLLLLKWDNAYRKLDLAEAKYEAGGRKERPTHRVGRCGCSGVRTSESESHRLPCNLRLLVRWSAGARAQRLLRVRRGARGQHQPLRGGGAAAGGRDPGDQAGHPRCACGSLFAALACLHAHLLRAHHAACVRCLGTQLLCLQSGLCHSFFCRGCTPDMPLLLPQEPPGTNAYFVFFTSQTAAAAAAQCSIFPEGAADAFKVCAAPGPEEVNLPSARSPCTLGPTGYHCFLRRARMPLPPPHQRPHRVPVLACLPGCCSKARSRAAGFQASQWLAAQVNWPVLWTPKRMRAGLRVVGCIVLAITIAFPVGIFTGAAGSFH